jgi:hypothetical protein
LILKIITNPDIKAMNQLFEIETLGSTLIQSELFNLSETDKYRFACVDLSIASKTRDNIFKYYEYLDLLVRDCQNIKKIFLKKLDPDFLSTYQLITKLVTFYYDIFNTVFDITSLSDVLDEIKNTDMKVLMQKYQDTITISQRLWKKGQLRNPDKIMTRYHDAYYNLIDKIKKNNIDLTNLKRYLEAQIELSDNKIILQYLFGPKLWLHSHYLDHLQNIYYYLKFQDRFEIKPGSHHYFCFMQNRETNTILNGMLVNKNDTIPMYQEHIFIHHNLYDKLYHVSPNNISMYLHSFAYHTFSNVTQQITVFPLAVMYNIFMNYERKGLVNIDVQRAPLFNPMPDGFIYQPLLCIGDGNNFCEYWKL